MQTAILLLVAGALLAAVAEQRALLSRAVWIRSRDRDHRFHEEGALTALIRFLRKYADDPEALRTRLRWLYAHGDERGAADALVDVFDRFPTVLAMAERLRVGRMLLHLEQFRGAEEVYDAVIAWDEPLAEAWVGKARCLAERRMGDEAQAAARRSIEIEPNAKARGILRRTFVVPDPSSD